MDWKQYTSVAALCVSLGSFTLSYNLSRQSAVTSVRPVLAFQFGADGWSIRNVGNGAALDLLIAMKTDDNSGWTQPLRIPPLSRDGEYGLQPWDVYTNARTLGATYTDVLKDDILDNLH